MREAVWKKKIGRRIITFSFHPYYGTWSAGWRWKKTGNCVAPFLMKSALTDKPPTKKEVENYFKEEIQISSKE